MFKKNKALQGWEALASLKLTIACMVLLMSLVAACTLAQVNLGTFYAVKIFFRSFFLYARIPGTSIKIPVFPAGGAVGGLLLANLVSSHFYRFELSSRKLGIWLTHFGLILLFIGEFVTGFASVESQMAIDEGRTLNYAEISQESEIAIVDTSDPKFDRVFSIPEKIFRKKTKIEDPRLPFTVLIKRYYPNAVLDTRASVDQGMPSMATAGSGPGLLVFERPLATADDQINQPAAFVELINGSGTLGTWLLSTAIPQLQGFSFDGRNYHISIRPKRDYMPFSLTLKKFSHDVYPGTDIPRNFSSLVHLSDPSRGEDRDVRIYMNHPLRYGGKTFYQASFAKNDTMSIFQVMRNPGWLLPYAACALVVLGLLLHFLMRFEFIGLRTGKSA